MPPINICIDIESKNRLTPVLFLKTCKQKAGATSSLRKRKVS